MALVVVAGFVMPLVRGGLDGIEMQVDNRTATDWLLLERPELFDELLEADGVDQEQRIQVIEGWQDAAAQRLGLGAEWYELKEAGTDV